MAALLWDLVCKYSQAASAENQFVKQRCYAAKSAEIKITLHENGDGIKAQSPVVGPLRDEKVPKGDRETAKRMDGKIEKHR